ncbi:MAG: hypothetical protein ISS35_02460 [Kiritimatiellae bacterium]|nr:hypothetical protein [Kiritimatiellia bacterium]
MRPTLIVLLFAWTAVCSADSPSIADCCADQAAIERIYHKHRIGTKQSFEEVMPASLIEKNVRLAFRKEAILRQRYGLAITDKIVEAEVKRINTTTRAPEILTEIKAALGNNPARFARCMARPIVVERELRYRFNNDDELHAAQRKQAEQARQKLLDGGTPGNMHEVTWEMTPRPADARAVNTAQPRQTQGKARSNLYSVEATVQVAQPLSTPVGEKEQNIYFEDLNPELQKVLRAQLRKKGDVSAVIEMPTGFLVFVTEDISTERLGASLISIPKQSYETWLEQQEIQP